MLSRDELLADLRDKIDRRGWALVSVFGTAEDPTPPFTYTVGLTAVGHPELIVYGLPPQVAGAILNRAGDRIRAGDPVMAGQRLTGLVQGGLQLVALRAADTSALTTVRAIYGASDDVLQLVWPDAAGRMPWEAGPTSIRTRSH